MLPLVSVIIPNYNKEKYISRCLNSLLKQTYPNIEIIFIDDCSSDRSIEIVMPYEKKFRKIRIIQNPVNMGVAISRNIGLTNASGKYITTLDSDDEYLPDKIANEVKVLEENVDSDYVAYVDVIVKYKDKDVLLSTNIRPGDDTLKDILFRKIVIPTYVMYHKSKINNLNYWFDRTLEKYEDWDSMIRALNCAKLIYAGEPGVIYHQENTGLSRGSIFSHFYWISVVFLKNYNSSSWIKRCFGLFYVFWNMFMHKFRLI